MPIQDKSSEDKLSDDASALLDQAKKQPGINALLEVYGFWKQLDAIEAQHYNLTTTPQQISISNRSGSLITQP